MKNENSNHKRRAWNNADRQAFADGARTKAHTFGDRRKEQSRKACRTFRWNG